MTDIDIDIELSLVRVTIDLSRDTWPMTSLAVNPAHMRYRQSCDPIDSPTLSIDSAVLSVVSANPFALLSTVRAMWSVDEGANERSPTAQHDRLLAQIACDIDIVGCLGCWSRSLRDGWQFTVMSTPCWLLCAKSVE